MSTRSMGCIVNNETQADFTPIHIIGFTYGVSTVLLVLDLFILQKSPTAYAQMTTQVETFRVSHDRYMMDEWRVNCLMHLRRVPCLQERCYSGYKT